MKYIEQNEIQRRNRATGSQQKMELFEKSGHKEFRNNYKEDRAGVRDELVRRLNIRNLGIPYKIKPEAECITTNPSLSSMQSLILLIPGLDHLGFLSLFLFQNIPSQSHLGVFAPTVLYA